MKIPKLSKNQLSPGEKIAKAIPFLLIFVGVIGVIAAYALTYDKIQVLKNPNYQPSCNLNPILSCGSVMVKEQASLLGVPNTVFGLATFPVLITIGVMMLAGAKFKHWFWQAVQGGVTAGFVFILYLFFQGVFRIKAICPWCFGIWITMIPLFWYVSLYNLRQGNLKFKIINKKTLDFVERHHGDFMLVTYLVLLGILVIRFWYYWSTLI